MFALLLTLAAQTIAAPAPAADWRTAPLAGGSWTYRATPAGSEALFENAGSAVLVVRCDRASRSIIVGGSMPGAAVTIATTSAQKGSANGVFAANDPILDALAFSRGRFAVRFSSGSQVVVPAWPEPARSIEDCRN